MAEEVIATPVSINAVQAAPLILHKEKNKYLEACKKYLRATSNWLNGLPIEEPHFDPDGLLIGSQPRPTSMSRSKKKSVCIPRKKKKTKAPEDDNKPVSGKNRIFQVPAIPGSSYQTFGDNAVRTAKYSMASFIPKNLYEQFHRVANFYFLLVIILQCIPAISNVSPWIAMMPLTVICIATAIKDGLEDWKRHRSDNKVNYSTARVLRRANSPVTPVEYSVSTPIPENSFRKRLKDSLFKFKQSIFEFKAIDEHDHGEINRWKAKYWRDIAVGDVVLVRENEPMPADLLVVSTSEPDGRCFVETTNLDGETNLKLKEALAETQWVQSLDEAVELQMLIETEPPSNNMHSFNGKVVIPRYDCAQPREDVIPINLEEVLLRGCTLRNTDWIIGCALFTGQDTKLMLNTGVTPSKRSRIERQMNPQIILSFILLFIICVACAIVQGNLVSSKMINAPFWYSSFGSRVYASSWFTGFLTFWSSMVLFQTLVPISLYITVEAYFIHQDLELYDEKRDKKCVPRAWNISDDLGQIEYLFSDKTGTLTRNIMEFRQCSIDGMTYGHLPDHEEWNTMEAKMHDLILSLNPSFVPPTKPSFVDPKLIQEIATSGQKIIEFFIALATCHTVLCDQDAENPLMAEYKAQSPDEAALVRTARDLGIIFLGREMDDLKVSAFGVVHSFVLLQVLEFTSARKRMSVILRNRQSGDLILYCKGADNVIMERLRPDEDVGLKEETLNSLEKFAESGLRTLCIAKRVLPPDVYSRWSVEYREACSALEDREQKMDAQADLLEQSLQLLGATAIEDRLQEGVPECIETLQKAGIKIWVLTGDKLETAMNIGFSCRLLNSRMILLVINGNDEPTVSLQLKEAMETLWLGNKNAKDTQEFSMVIEGLSLRFSLSHTLRKHFLSLASQCKAVICCRVSPLQKAKVVELVSHSRMAMTMAIGDGANDVSMLQAADIGIGINGEEGMQAVMASDYSVGQFRHLTRLLLLHGRWSYHRSAKVTLCSFHKNIAFVVCAFWYQWSCAFTSNYIYDYLYANFFNILLAMPPIVALGCFDQDVSEKAAIQVPQLYRRGIAHQSYSLALFLVYTVNGIWQSLTCFFVPRLAYSNGIVDWHGWTESRLFLGNAVALSVIICVNVFVLFNTSSWNPFIIVAFFLILLALLLLLIICSFISGLTLFGAVYQLMQPLFYATIVLSCAVAVTPQLLYKLTQSLIWPNDIDIIRESEKYLNKIPQDTEQQQAVHEVHNLQQQDSNQHRVALERSKSKLSKSFSVVADRIRRHLPATIINLGSRRVERHTGYAFSQQDRGNIVLACSPMNESIQ